MSPTCTCSTATCTCSTTCACSRTCKCADLSQQSLTRIEWLTFSGKINEDVLLFVQAVLRFALSVNRAEDGAWVAKFAYGCLKDEALKWFETVDAELRGKWVTLRELLIAQFGNTYRPPLKTSYCRIKVLRSNGTEIGYVGYTSPATETRFERSVADALVFHMPLPAPQQAIDLSYVTNPDVDKSHFPFIGMEHMDTTWWTLRAVDGGRPRAKAFSNTGKEASGNIWSLRISEGAEEFTAQWTDDNGRVYPLTFLTYTAWINDPNSQKGFWMRKVGDLNSSHEALRLVLERL